MGEIGGDGKMEDEKRFRGRGPHYICGNPVAAGKGGAAKNGGRLGVAGLAPN